jgi:hypothetical protein
LNIKNDIGGSLDLRRIDEISLNSWPSLQQVLYDGWILRFSKGYTKRSNSVNPLYEGRLNTEDKIRFCEEVYEMRGLSPVFRIVPFSPARDLDQQLERKGYHSIDLTHVQYLDLTSCRLDCPENSEICIEDEGNWIRAYQRISGLSGEQNRIHRELISTIPSKKCLMLLKKSNEVLSCGLAVIEDGYLGLFDVFTADMYRNRYFGMKIVSSMLHWGMQQGAKHAYLQLVIANAPARSLYAKFGFAKIYEYWYRVRDK